jgi:hypothetical protein
MSINCACVEGGRCWLAAYDLPLACMINDLELTEYSVCTENNDVIHEIYCCLLQLQMYYFVFYYWKCVQM